ncbi:MAG: hypothetical protein LUE98_11225 [Tannerellaceae bacterium]|nr:hypothetical protein [Tannerellaceae bacterium]
MGDLKENYHGETFVVYRALFRWQRVCRCLCYAMIAGTLICVVAGFYELYGQRGYSDVGAAFDFLHGCFAAVLVGGGILFFPLYFSLPDELMIFTPDAVWLHERQNKYISIPPGELDSIVIDSWTYFPQGLLPELRSRLFPWYYQTHVKVIKLEGDYVHTYKMVLANCRGGKLEQKIRNFYPDLKIYMQEEIFYEM